MQRHLLSLLAATAAHLSVFAQNTFPSTGSVGIGTTAPLASSLLEVKSTTKGVLLSRMTAVQRSAIVSPAQGLLVYQTDGTKGFYYYDAGWKVVTPATSSFAAKSLNNLTSPTAINQHLLPKITKTYDLGSSSLSWRNLHLRDDIYLDGTRFVSNAPGTASFNAFLGSFAGEAITSGTFNTAIGHNALLKDTSGSYNTVLGANALYNNTNGNSNTAIGQAALYANTSGVYNTATGFGALFSNTTGNLNTANGRSALYNNTTGYSNTASGAYSLLYNTTGNSNTAMGEAALYRNTTGNSNTAMGTTALYSNTTGYSNTATGFLALSSTADGFENTATGYKALTSNTTGFDNTAIGVNALYNNTDGFKNTATGFFALYNNNGVNNTATGFQALSNTTTGYQNTAIGLSTLLSNTTGVNNTAVGVVADVAYGYLTNATAVGYNAIATASNQIMLGNTSVTAVMAAGPHVIYSDGRFKKDIDEKVPGLSFINKLRPVTYHYDIHGLNTHLRSESHEQGYRTSEGNRPQETEMQQREEESIKAKEQILYTGFVAQEVEQAAKELKYDFSGLHKPANDKDVYGLSYSDFVVPLVKAVQELDQKTQQIEQLEKKNDELEGRLVKLEALLKNTLGNAVDVSSAYLEQASPNPSRSNTLVRYGIPDATSSARLTLTNAKGQVLKEISLSNRGTGQVSLNTQALPSGVYTYTLWVDSRQADSKQLVVAR